MSSPLELMDDRGDEVEVIGERSQAREIVIPHEMAEGDVPDSSAVALAECVLEEGVRVRTAGRTGVLHEELTDARRKSVHILSPATMLRNSVSVKRRTAQR